MSHAENHLIRLQDLRLFQDGGSLDESLARQAAQTAGLVGAESCSIMLLDHGDGANPRMRVCATLGPLPDAALHASIGSVEGISGQVPASRPHTAGRRPGAPRRWRRWRAARTTSGAA
jgi:L-methionine (R)-S-oxide reductase